VIPFDANRFQELRRALGATLGTPLRVAAETGSTNDDAAEAARAGAPHGATFLAESQTAGRGRRGHRWTSPPGENLTFSLVLRPATEPARVSALTLVAGAAVRAAVAERIAPPVAIKWPNDVVVGRRKLAGILVESQLSGSVVESVVVGIGINVKMRALPPEIAEIATSLSLLGDPAPDREALLARVLAELEPRLRAFAEQGPIAAVREVREYDALRGERVTIDAIAGTAEGIGDDGALIVRSPSGRLETVSSGNVQW
jgi:BirA family transcriptional regulator, biotin operon repressor / biotin---[acetyl-CoA-carboxylase] ligase